MLYFELMDVSGSLVISTSECMSRYCEAHADAPGSSEGDLINLSVNDLISGFTEHLKIQNGHCSIRGLHTAPHSNNAICLVKEDELNHCHRTKSGNSAHKKCLEKSATFPCSNKAASAVGSHDGEVKRERDLTDENGHRSSVNQPCLQHSISLPTPLKLVSAMKGSREKLGKPSLKLSVKWAPDVYDPTPTSVSHMPSNKPQRRRSDGKRNGKNKQKAGGKSSRGSKGKDKKQGRRSAYHSNRGNSSLVDHHLVSSIEPPASVAKFEVDSPDPFCGSSFLKQSVQQLHFPVAEAT